MTEQGLLQGVEERSTLFAQGREIAAHATKGSSPSRSAKAAGNLLLHFDHAQVPFGQVVVKGHRQMLHEQQNGILLLAQAIQQVLRSTLLASPLPLGGGCTSDGRVAAASSRMV